MYNLVIYSKNINRTIYSKNISRTIYFYIHIGSHAFFYIVIYTFIIILLTPNRASTSSINSPVKNNDLGKNNDLVFTEKMPAKSNDLISIESTERSKPQSIIINSDMQYNYALERFNNNDFETAIIEFSRFIYFFPKDKRIKDALFKKGVSLFQIKRYQEAAAVFKDLSYSQFNSSYLKSNSNDYPAPDNFSDNNNELITDAFFMLSKTLCAMDKDGSSEMILQDLLLLNDEKINSEIEDRVYYELVLIYIKRAGKKNLSQKESLNSLVQAAKYIDKMTPLFKKNYKMQVLKQDIKDIIKHFEQKEKNPVIAAIASVIPGGGFFYCNRYQDALAAFLVNSAFILASYESFNDGNSALGSLISFVGFGFYGGSIYGGISSCYKYNKSLIQNGINNINQFDVDKLLKDKEIFKNNRAVNDDFNSSISYQYNQLIFDEPQNKKGYKIPIVFVNIYF